MSSEESTTGVLCKIRSYFEILNLFMTNHLELVKCLVEGAFQAWRTSVWSIDLNFANI